MRQLSTLAALLAAICCAEAFSASRLRADTVVLKTGGAGSRLTGEIVEFTGKELRLRQAAGRDSIIPTDKVASIETAWTPDHLAGERMLAEGNYAEAVAKLLSAVKQEKRRWAQRRILARAVKGSVGLGQFDQAGAMFLIIVENDPSTQYFDTIPLSWNPHQPSAALESKADQWLAGEKQSDATREAAELLAASWLLSTGKRGAVTAVLKRLAGSGDPRVAALAKAQLWRTELVTAKLDDVARWRAAIEKMPEPLRAGPYYIVGRVLSRLGEGEQAALALMRVPILHGGDRPLAASALNAAAGELVKLDRRGEALVLYRETVNNYPETDAAVEAKARITELGSN
jgi:tetratricopeptide (TPR) repeat protein